VRKRRVIIYDDETMILDVLGYFFGRRGYEVFSYAEPRVCPVYADHSRCEGAFPCADVLITDYRMPQMNGLALLRRQKEMGCRLDIRNKAIMSGYLDDSIVAEAQHLGCNFFTKPIKLAELTSWLEECEMRSDLSSPLADRRRQERRPADHEIWFSVESSPDPLTGKLVNMSECGFCFRSGVSLTKGQVVHLLSDLPLPRKSAEVRWTGNAGGACLAGLHCC
jgi:DNA-binding NtrC family response regulator